MKKTITLVLASTMSLGLMSFGLLSSGGKTNRTGGHGETGCGTATGCHTGLQNAGTTVSVTGSGTLLTAGYVAGTVYTINITIAKAGQTLFGFDFQALNSANTTVGTLTAGTDNKLSGTAPINVVHNGNGGLGTGTFTYSFTWLAPAASSGAVTFWFSGLAANNNGGTSGDFWNNGSVVINPAAASTLAVTVVGSNATCNGASNGSATATATGGATPYTYLWSPSGGTAATATGLAAGTYTCTVTGGGTATQTVTISQPTVMSASSAQTNVLCNGSSTGSATVTPGGGTGPYTYSWAPSGGTGATANGLAAGTYTCIITDASSCTKTQTATITQPIALTSSLGSQTDVSCFLSCDGSTTVTSGGGTAPYTYLWNDATAQSTITATGLCAQSYIVIVTDDNGCSSSSIASIASPTAINIQLLSSTDVSCYGGNNGQLSTSVSGGSPGYTYAWTPNAGSSAQVTNLSAGSYQLLVTDVNGCSKTITNNIQQPQALTFVDNVIPSTCSLSNGGASVIASGGTSPYAYFWSPTGSTSSTITSVSSGTYSVTITDANACQVDTSVSIVNIEGPTGITFTTTQPPCNGTSLGTATVSSVTGGQPLYTYLWSGIGSQTTQTATSLPAGTYSVTVTDANFCSTGGVVIVTEPSALSATTSFTPETVAGDGTATVVASGGTSPYSYSWAPTGGTLDNATGLTGGTYTVTITDNNACTVVQTVDVLSTVGFVPTNFQSSVKVFPNPTKGDFSVEIYSELSNQYTLKIMNVIGQVIHCETLELSNGKNLIPVSIDNSKEGLYFIQIVSNEGIVNIPVTKLK